MKKHYFFATATLMLLVSVGLFAQASKPARENLKHAWAFESDGSDTVGNANATLEGSASISDGALVSSDGGNYAWADGSVVQINTYSELSIGVWFKSASVDANTGYTMVFYGGETIDGRGANGLFLSMSRGNDGDNGPYSRAGLSTGNIDAPNVQESGCNMPIEPDDAQLHHAVICVDATNVYYYFDGVISPDSPVALADQGNTLSALSNALVYFGKSGWNDPGYNGSIYDVMIFDKVLTEDEISYLYGLNAAPLSYGSGSAITSRNLVEFSVSQPNTGLLKIQGVDKLNSVELIALNGQLMRTFTNGETLLNVEGLASGLYVVRISTNEGTGVQKVIVR
ncbi:MAG: T9SS type A sorting domain-containing protein [Bacteroidales bacterium]|nr:T9SS type A sorting domain-containing protein [Bacteroidales bacterium]